MSLLTHKMMSAFCNEVANAMPGWTSHIFVTALSENLSLQHLDGCHEDCVCQTRHQVRMQKEDINKEPPRLSLDSLPNSAVSPFLDEGFKVCHPPKIDSFCNNHENPNIKAATIRVNVLALAGESGIMTLEENLDQYSLLYLHFVFAN